MIGYQLEATNLEATHVKVRGNVIYTDKQAAEAVLKTLVDTERGDMSWHLAVVDVQMRKV